MRRLLILSTCVALTLMAAASAAAAPTPGREFVRAFLRLEDSLRVAIERQPEGLTVSLDASERVCSLGAGAEERGETVAAAADWNALAQVVDQLDEPGLRGVERAFRRSASTLAELESRFAGAWRSEPARVRALRAAAAEVRRGIRRSLAGLQPLREAFAAWKSHRCEAALAAIDNSRQALPAAVAIVGRGMDRLLRSGPALSGRASARFEPDRQPHERTATSWSASIPARKAVRRRATILSSPSSQGGLSEIVEVSPWPPPSQPSR
jgi:hypothetical protein